MTPPPLPAGGESPPPASPLAVSPARTLRRLFLTLFLRGRSARGLQKAGVPRSIGKKLFWVLFIYGLMGFMALVCANQPVFTLSLYLHGMTLVFLGMFVAASAGEILFNQQEADILLHRPVDPRALLWAKIAVLVQVSLWLAGAFNLVGMAVGVVVPDGGWLFPLVHAVSTALEALFCTGMVVLVYQLCLRWFGRERLDGLMTTAQVLLAITAVAGGQIVPRIIGRFGVVSKLATDAWWLGLMPPAWFAGFDDALAGGGSRNSWLLAGLGLPVTAGVLWLAFGKLADNYVSGLQMMGETAAPRVSRGPARRRWLDRLLALPPLCWWVRDSVARGSFLLTLAYLTRDRDMKLRVYPGMAPMLVMPFVMLMQGGMGGFGIAFTGAYLGLVPMLALSMLQFSQHWQASDLFRAAPLAGPAPLYHGARRAVLLFLALPLTVFFAVVAWLMTGRSGANLLLLLPGAIMLPLYALIPGLGGRAIPLSQPIESAKSAGRGLRMIGVMFASFALAGLASAAWQTGWFAWFLLAESVVAVGLYLILRQKVSLARWSSME